MWLETLFYPPKNFMDGVKIYGGKNRCTYDGVPIYSEPEIIYVVFG